MRFLIKVILAISFLLFTVNCSLSTVNAAVPHLLNYQGRLTDKDNKPLEGAYNLTFRIYDAESAGNPLWEETHSGVVIQKGLFNILLGSVKNLDLVFNEPYFLQIQVGSEVMSPRQQITSSGYAIRAERAEQANNATTLANIGVSATPAPNKILPLDNNARIPLSALGLKVYDSGWFAASAGTTYSKTHNLGTTKILLSMYASANSDGSGNTSTLTDMHEYPIGITPETTMCALTTTTISLRTSSHGIADFIDSSGSGVQLTSGYIRIIMLALE